MAKVDKRRETNGVALVRVGKAKKRERDDELAAPKAVRAKLPTDPGESHIARPKYQTRCSDGVYWVFAREEATIVRRKKKDVVPLQRLYWLDSVGRARTSADLFEPDSLPTFDVRAGRAIMGVEGGGIVEIDLATGRARSLEVLGLPRIKRQKFYFVTYVSTLRVLAQCYADDGPFVQVFDRDERRLVARFSRRVRGEVALTKDGVLLAGGAKLLVFAIAKDELVELASFDEPRLRMADTLRVELRALEVRSHHKISLSAPFSGCVRSAPSARAA